MDKLGQGAYLQKDFRVQLPTLETVASARTFVWR